MQLVSREAPGRAPVTELTGRLADQAALMGVLEQLYSLGVPLLAIECLKREAFAVTWTGTKQDRRRGT